MSHTDDSWFKYKVEIRPAEWEKKNCRWKISKIFSIFLIENRNIDDEKFLDEEKCEKI